MREIGREEIIGHRRLSNPWWLPPHSPAGEVVPLTPRLYLEPFFALLRMKEVHRALVLMGPRRVGKTVLIQHAIQRLLAEGVPARQILFASVDSPLFSGLRLDEYLRFFAEATDVELSKEEIYVFFDEIQYLSGWERHLKSLVDAYPRARFVASVSAAAALRRASSESGAGRFTDFLLPPLIFREYLTLIGQKVEDPQHDIVALNREFVDYVNWGGYPEVALSPAIRADPQRFIRSDIVEKVLLRDLPSLYGIQDVPELNQLFTTLAYIRRGRFRWTSSRSARRSRRTRSSATSNTSRLLS